MTDKLHQITVEYVHEEDRMLLRMGTKNRAELQLWLTRRLVRALWLTIVGSFEAQPEIQAQPTQQVRDAVLSMDQQVALQDIDFSQPRETGNTPLPEADAALLASGFNLGPGVEGGTRIAFATRDGKEIALNLAEEGVRALIHMLRAAADKAKWDLNLSFGDDAVIVPTGEKRVH